MKTLALLLIVLFGQSTVITPERQAAMNDSTLAIQVFDKKIAQENTEIQHRQARIATLTKDKAAKIASDRAMLGLDGTFTFDDARGWVKK